MCYLFCNPCCPHGTQQTRCSTWSPMILTELYIIMGNDNPESKLSVAYRRLKVATVLSCWDKCNYWMRHATIWRKCYWYAVRCCPTAPQNTGYDEIVTYTSPVGMYDYLLSTESPVSTDEGLLTLVHRAYLFTSPLGVSTTSRTQRSTEVRVARWIRDVCRKYKQYDAMRHVCWTQGRPGRWYYYTL